MTFSHFLGPPLLTSASRSSAVMDEILAEAERLFAVHPERGVFPGFDEFLARKPSVNQRAPRRRFLIPWTLLQYACRLKMFPVLERLLRVPGIDVNVGDDVNQWRPAQICIYMNSVDCLKRILRDPRLDCTHRSEYFHQDALPTLLEFALWHERHDAIRCLLALRPLHDNAIPLDHPGLGNLLCPSVVLIRDYLLRPLEVRRRVRIELGLPATLAADFFTFFLLLSDDFLAVTPVSAPSSPLVRILQLSCRLPIELQMVLACRAADDAARDVVLRRDFEPAILAITASFPHVS